MLDIKVVGKGWCDVVMLGMDLEIFFNWGKGGGGLMVNVWGRRRGGGEVYYWYFFLCEFKKFEFFDFFF